MTKQTIIPSILIAALLLPSCFKEIDTEPMKPTVEDYFTVQYSIRKIQSYYKFSRFSVIEVDTAQNTSWDLAFESAGEGSRVLLGWASYSKTIGSGKYEFSEITQELILELIERPEEWDFDDPSYVNNPDSLTLTNHWEVGEVYIQNRGRSKDTYYAIQFISSTANSYTFRYASAQSLDQVREATIQRDPNLNYVYYSYTTDSIVEVEPLRTEWDLLCTPYSGWWETNDPGVYAPFNMSGIMINNENGVRIARVFDPEVTFEELDLSSIHQYDFTEMKGAIGSDWKILGAVGSTDLYTMDTNKKYLMKKTDPDSGKQLYFKLQIVDYKLDGQDHYPTIEFKYLESE